MATAEPQVYIWGRFVPASQAHLKIFDLGVIMGATCTDMTRTYNHTPYRLEDHVDRLCRSCKYTEIPPPIDRQEIVRVSRELIEHNASLIEVHEDLGMVHFITPGESPIYAGSAGLPADAPPTFVIHTFPLPFEKWRHYYTEGCHVVTPSIRHVPPQCVDPKIKCRSRMHWWLADRQTHRVDPKAVSLCLDLEGNVAETAGSNFLIVRDGVVISPSRRNILWGVSLQTVAELCAELGVDFIERDIQTYDVVNADEAFLTSTPYGVAPATRINGIPIGSGQPDGPIFKQLADAWSQRVGLDVVQQIMAS
jgi:branched-chain amino acid aminotransferase